MINRNRWILIAAVLWIASGPWIGTARADDVQVNTYTTGNQADSSVAMDADGDAVVVWRSTVGGNPNQGIQGQRYAADGSPAGVEFRVDTDITASVGNPAVAMDADGGFVVVWNSFHSGVDEKSIQGQRFAADGSAIGGQFQISTATLQYSPSVAMNSGGDFVVAWTGRSDGTDSSGRSAQGRLYTADGSPVGGQFQINTYTTDRQENPSVAMGAGGDFVAVWSGFGGGADPSYSVQGQRYAADGSRVGGQFQVNTYTTGNQDGGRVTMDADGDFVVVWDGPGGGTDTTPNGIHGQHFASDGSRVGGEFQANTYTTNSQYTPSVAMDADGDFVVAWVSLRSAGTDSSGASIQAQRYLADGSTERGQFQVNTYTTSHQTIVSAAIDNAGSFVIVWQSFGSSGTDLDLSIQKTGDVLTVGQPPPSVVEIPTLSAPNLLLLAGLLALLAALRLRGLRA